MPAPNINRNAITAANGDGVKSQKPLPSPKSETRPEVPRDTTREVFETVVFVVVLVLMLKLFIAEAFVIPTGSMAPTLWGDQVRCTCEECGHQFPINASNGGERGEITDYVCENCGYTLSKGIEDLLADEHQRLSPAEWNERYQTELKAHLKASLSTDLFGDRVFSGDRVLVSKYAYHIAAPARFQVPVFKFPQEPYSEKDRTGMNYIKRLVGLGGETIGVFNGDLYRSTNLKYDHIPANQRPQRDLDAWWPSYMYPNDEVAINAFREGKFEPIRKQPDEILAVRRIVFDLNQQPKTLSGVRRLRWQVDDDEGHGWELLPGEKEHGFRHKGTEEGYILYQHLDPWANIFRQVQPPQQAFQQKVVNPDRLKDPRHYVVDFIGYNTHDQVELFTENWRDHWVCDLLLECKAEIPSADAVVSLELSKGRDRFRAVFTKGECRLLRLATGADGKEQTQTLGSHPTTITKAGVYGLRLANFDSRLTVWVDNKPVNFAKDQTDYGPPPPNTPFEPFPKNDLLQPARIGAAGDVKVTHISLWRDLLYRCGWPSLPNPDNARRDIDRKRLERQRQEMLQEWKQFPSCGDVQTYYVQPGHFLMFGDNVNSSADSRSWGTVPERLMLGRAIVVYWPFSRIGVIE